MVLSIGLRIQGVQTGCSLTAIETISHLIYLARTKECFLALSMYLVINLALYCFHC